MLEVEVQVEIRPTEDEEKVKKAVERFFKVNWISMDDYKFTKIYRGVGRGLEAIEGFYHALRKQQILDAARQYLFRGKREEFVRFYLNKQVAFAGSISFCSYEYGESPLGAITVIIKTREVEKLIEWLTPRTVKGKPIETGEPPDP
ncbi:MAG: hypothetical protein DRJ55_00480 [Thermoprotei archaeon]|nr:MAG: hypothetical protein DRJ55_00480 [Thermoprotei archaeon]